jgi:hypothetical protein
LALGNPQSGSASKTACSNSKAQFFASLREADCSPTKFLDDFWQKKTKWEPAT